jgi:hypothetical protein
LIEADGADWFQVSLDAEWLVQYRLDWSRGRIAFTEMRLLPRGAAATEGVTPALLRRIPVGEHRRLFLQEVAQATLTHLERPDRLPITLSRDAFSVGFESDEEEVSVGLGALAPTKVKYGRRDKRWWAELARFYAALVEAGTTRPIPVMAEQMGLSPATVNALVRDARKMGLLTSTTPGRAGGRLTAKGHRILENTTPEGRT